MNNKIKITDFKITSLKPNVKDPEILKVLPNLIHPEKCTLIIHNVHNAISNAIRRTISEEMPVLRMMFDISDIDTNDKFIIPEMIYRRIQLIPILQDTNIDSHYEIDYVNMGPIVRDLKTKDIKVKNGKLPCNDTFTLVSLQPGKYIKIKNIRIHRDFAYNFGGYSNVAGAVSLAVDQQPINLYDKNSEGISVSVSNPQVWKLEFVSNGSIDTVKSLIAACDNLIERVRGVENLLYNITTHNEEYMLSIPEESHTLGNLFMKEISDLYPDIRFVCYTVPSVVRAAIIRIKTDDKIETIFKKTIESLVAKFKAISAELVKL